MIREIRHRWTGAVLWSGEAETVKDALHQAIAAGSDLRDSNLSDSNLSGSNLSGSDLRDSNLRDSNLSGSNLSGSNLRGSNLSGSDLRDSNLRDSDLRDSNLSDSNLSGSDLRDSNLRGSNLRDSNLRGSNLSGSDLRDSLQSSTRIETGESWHEYLTEVVPAFLTAGGKPLDSFTEHFQCHTWENCPTAHAFDTHGLTGVPILLRPRAEQFIRYFDSGLIPWPLPTKEG